MIGLCLFHQYVAVVYIFCEINDICDDILTKNMALNLRIYFLKKVTFQDPVNS